ncbi:MAG TPA: hypothetical protein VHY22_17280, partial [Chthoniobacteraceae bacterium]|nr:hypothetical protein [Chthoniobacteraceae bacterium]
MRFTSLILLVSLSAATLHADPPEKVILSSGWQLQDGSRVPQKGAEISSASFSPKSWYSATVPGTVLTTLVDNHVYPEPLYGENNRPDVIPDSLCRTDWWYRSSFQAPADYAGKMIWLNFDGINYAADVWINGVAVGTINGAFVRGRFNLTGVVTPGKPAAVAVHIYPQPHPGVSHEHTLGAGNGIIGGISRIDGPTFACTIGWDWLPAIRDR